MAYKHFTLLNVNPADFLTARKGEWMENDKHNVAVFRGRTYKITRKAPLSPLQKGAESQSHTHHSLQ